MPSKSKHVVSVETMGKLMVRFAVGRVAQGESLLEELRKALSSRGRSIESSFWNELYVFAIFPVDVVLARSDFADSVRVRRATSHFAFAHLDLVFEQDGFSRGTESDWKQLVHGRFEEYWSCVKDGDAKALELLGMVALMRIAKLPDPILSAYAAITFAESQQVLPALIDSYEIGEEKEQSGTS
jgi:hypothetical protein